MHLAADLGVGRINFKQCDVVRGVNGNGFGLFGQRHEKKIQALEKQLKKACRLAERLGVETTAFSFFPDELPVCDQDPVHSLFVARDGSVAPCINTAYGGPSRFFQDAVMLPRLIFGRLPEQDLMAIWLSERCVSFRDRCARREQAYHRVLARSQFDASFIKLEETFQAARDAMSPRSKRVPGLPLPVWCLMAEGRSQRRRPVKRRGLELKVQHPSHRPSALQRERAMRNVALSHR